MATTAETPSTPGLSPPRVQAHCVYPPGRGRAPKRPRRGVAPQLSERLSRLESIINQFGAAAQENRLAQEASHAREASDTHSFDQDFSRLKVDESKSYYVNNALWVTLSNEVEELRDLLFEPASEDAGYESAPSPYPSHSSSITTTAASPSSQLGLNATIFGYRAIASSLQHFHPSLPRAVTLFAAFTDNVAPLVRIFHMPTLTRVYWDAIASLDSLDKYTEALLFAIHYSAVISLTPEQCLSILDETRKAALERCRFAVEQALARGNLLNTQNMTMLQAAVLFLSALPNEDDSRAAWSLTSLIYHIARTMGLHRDGTVFGLKPFETELRRRLWWQICIIDSRSSEYHCNEPIARGFASDTKPPLHINDVDLSPEMVEPPAEQWDHATDMTLSLVRCEAIQTGWKLGLIKQKQPRGPGSSNAPTADDSREPPKKRRALIQNLKARLRDKYLPICDSSVPFQLLSSAVARIILARFWLITQYSVAFCEAEADDRNKSSLFPGAPDSTGQLENSMRDELFQTSIEILEVSGMLLTNRDIMQWTWYSKTHIQWGAMAFVLSELCARPHSPACDRAWDCVTTVYDGWKVGGNQDDESRLALWRPIRRLMAKARYVREIQRTGPGRPAQAGRRTQWHDPAPCLPAAGSLSHYPLTTHTGAWYTPSQQMMSSMSTPESSLSGLSSVSHSKEPSDAFRRVLGTETLGPFMDLYPDWSWADDAGDTASSLAGIDLGIPSWLS
ncbi:hypothetical protein DL766_003724 [Monosporascus sp. MC13-8B]|uniref:Xylanolytic transcriptional activator regulatory domain-containing protein n=1 Tax=Monosporascus cannonballus TaxID=155416 RepID=A0ABY0GU73_9PEZI|nr:hypothetical protein DL762_010274 [Monosporascus cannonballus]RYO76618.1 hypothetical protein DL763_010302 [Monosporascus cannonballus]RYP32918.1 hypothetical protein DL766_003724 [Monosporascus sp. MC13-8B]